MKTIISSMVFIAKKLMDCVRVEIIRLSGNAQEIAQELASSGQAHCLQGEYAKAIDDLSLAIRLDPRNWQTRYNRGEAYRLKGDYDRAIADFTEAIRLNSTSALSYGSRGEAYLSKMLYEVAILGSKAIQPKYALADLAIADATESMRLDPKNVTAYINRAKAFGLKWEYDKAIEDCSQAIRLDPKCAIGYIERGNACCGKGEDDKGIEDYSQAIRLDPKNLNAYVNRGLTYRMKKEYAKAIEDFSQVIRLDPAFADAHLFRAYTHENKKDYDEAIKDYLHYIRFDSENIYVHTELAWMLGTCPQEGVRDGKKAIEHATKACELSHWNDAMTVGVLAAAHAETGNLKDASKCQKKAIEMGFDSKEDSEKAGQRLKLYQEGKPYRDE